jgi:hypothetical protein
MPKSAAAGVHSAGLAPRHYDRRHAAQPSRDGLARQDLGDFELLQPDKAAEHFIARAPVAPAITSRGLRGMSLGDWAPRNT